MTKEYQEFVEALQNLKIAIQNSQELADDVLTKVKSLLK